MVAETHSPLKKPHKGHYRPRIPLPVRLKIRALYIVQQINPSEIAAQIGYSKEQVQGLINREGWVAVKNNAKRKLEEKGLIRMREQVEEVQEAFGIRSEELGIKSLEKLEEALDSDSQFSARDSQAYSQTAKNLYGIVRLARNLDTQGSESKGQTTVVFLGDLPRVERQEKRAIEVEVSLTPSSSLPIPAIPVPLGEALPTSEGKDTGSGVAQQAMD